MSSGTYSNTGAGTEKVMASPGVVYSIIGAGSSYKPRIRSGLAVQEVPRGT